MSKAYAICILAGVIEFMVNQGFDLGEVIETVKGLF
jgi:hypothetical protein